MTNEQKTLLELFLKTGVISVASRRTHERTSKQLSHGGFEARLVNLQALMGVDVARRTIADALAAEIRLRGRTVSAIATVPFGCDWLGSLVADRLHLPLLMPNWLSDVRDTPSFVHGRVRLYSRVWIVDGDPDAADGERLVRAARVLSSGECGLIVEGATAIFERNGSTLRNLLTFLPGAQMTSLLDIRLALSELANGLMPTLATPADAKRNLDLLDLHSSSSHPRP